MLPSSTTPPARSLFWDIVRGIGILSIVMGHCFSKSIIYVYTYHLAIFFFVSGFLYNEKKYGQEPFAHIGAKLKSSWPKYMFYMSLFILFHNLFQAVGINVPGENYTFSQTLAHLGNSVVFYGAEPMGGALWFVPTWVLACGFFGGTVWFSLYIFPENRNKKIGKLPLSALTTVGISVLFGATGAYLMFHDGILFYRVHLVLLVQPFFAVGWVIKNCPLPFKKLLKWYVGILSGLVLGIMVNVYQLYIDIAVGRIGNGWQYFCLAFLGIYCCLVLAALIEKVEAAGRIFAFWGKHSFDIMALHFFVFKMVDGIYGRIFHYPLEYYSAFPHSFGNILWPVYVILGTTLPALAGSILDKIRIKKVQ